MRLQFKKNIAQLGCSALFFFPLLSALRTGTVVIMKVQQETLHPILHIYKTQFPVDTQTFPLEMKEIFFYNSNSIVRCIYYKPRTGLLLLLVNHYKIEPLSSMPVSLTKENLSLRLLPSPLPWASGLYVKTLINNVYYKSIIFLQPKHFSSNCSAVHIILTSHLI